MSYTLKETRYARSLVARLALHYKKKACSYNLFFLFVVVVLFLQCGVTHGSRDFFSCAAIEFAGDVSGSVGGRHVFELETALEYVSGTQGRQGSQKLQNYC